MFGKKSNALITKGKSTLSIFTKTLADLTANTEAMKAEDSRLGEEQAKMQAERDAMAQAIKVNENVSSKINEILGVSGDSFPCETAQDILDSSTEAE